MSVAGKSVHVDSHDTPSQIKRCWPVLDETAGYSLTKINRGAAGKIFVFGFYLRINLKFQASEIPSPSVSLGKTK